MKIKILAIGKLKPSPIRELISEYEKRLTWDLAIKELDPKNPKLESDALLSNLSNDEYAIVMDERGQNISSQELANIMEEIQLNHNGRVAFLIGGAEGHSPEVRDRANKIISFGKATWPHMLARLMLVEQIYRAQQILNNHPYHK